MNPIETISRFLEDFAFQVEVEGRARSPMIPKTETSWQGFTADAEKLLRSIRASESKLLERCRPYLLESKLEGSKQLYAALIQNR